MVVGTVVRRALEAARHVDGASPPWQDVLAGLSELTGSDSATYMAFDGVGNLLAFELRGGDSTARREYVDHYQPHDIMNPVARDATAGSWLDSAQAYPGARLERNMFYADFMCKHRMRQMLAFMTEMSPQWRSAICVQRSRVDERIAECLSEAPVRALTQTVTQALARERSRAGQAIAAVEASLLAFGEVVLLVARSGALAHVPGPAAQAWFARPGALVLRGGRLQHRDPALQAAWLDALQRAVGGAAATLALPGGPGLVHRLALASAPRALGSGGELVLVRIAADPSGQRASAPLLRAAFGLTAAEATVLAGLTEGLAPAECAARQGVAISTVRTQIAALMAKMGCSRQVDLVRKACALL